MVVERIGMVVARVAVRGADSTGIVGAGPACVRWVGFQHMSSPVIAPNPRILGFFLRVRVDSAASQVNTSALAVWRVRHANFAATSRVR